MKTQIVFYLIFSLTMKKDEMLNLIKSLARSQGCWGRLLRDLYELDEDTREQVFTEREAMNFKSGLDFILYLEGN